MNSDKDMNLALLDPTENLSLGSEQHPVRSPRSPLPANAAGDRPATPKGGRLVELNSRRGRRRKTMSDASLLIAAAGLQGGGVISNRMLHPVSSPYAVATAKRPSTPPLGAIFSQDSSDASGPRRPRLGVGILDLLASSRGGSGGRRHTLHAGQGRVGRRRMSLGDSITSKAMDERISLVNHQTSSRSRARHLIAHHNQLRFL